jgi:hypothetical protein
LAVILVVVTSLVIFFFFKNKSSHKDAQVKAYISLAKDKSQKAQELKDQDPAQAQQNMGEAAYDINLALNLDPTNSQAATLKKEIDQKSEDILKKYTVSDWPVFLSLDLIKTGFQPTKLDKSLNNLLLLDETQKTVVELDLDKRIPQILGGSYQFGQMEFAGINGQKVFVFSPDKGVSMIETDTNKITQVVKPDPEWGRISGLFAFAGNVYLLDEFKNQIWKYIPAQAGYSDKYEYLNGNNGIDFAGAKKMQVDYSVWVLKPGPEILRFTGGDKDFFSVSGLDESLKEISSFYVSDTTDSAYFLDPENSRLVLLDKTGKYLAQYLGEKFRTAKDLVVDEKGKKVYLLEGNKIHVVGLR